MQRVFRLIWRALIVISLVLCITSVVFWIRSYRTIETYHLTSTPARWRVMSAKGSLSLSREVWLNRQEMDRGIKFTMADVERLSKYTPAMFAQAFDSWSVALKAARNVLAALPEFAEVLANTEQLEMFAQSFGVPSSDGIVRKPDLLPEGGTANLISSLSQCVTDITNQEDPSAYPIS